jgi:hypothetical protein
VGPLVPETSDAGVRTQLRTQYSSAPTSQPWRGGQRHAVGAAQGQRGALCLRVISVENGAPLQ